MAHHARSLSLEGESRVEPTEEEKTEFRELTQKQMVSDLTEAETARLSELYKLFNRDQKQVTPPM